MQCFDTALQIEVQNLWLCVGVSVYIYVHVFMDICSSSSSSSSSNSSSSSIHIARGSITDPKDTEIIAVPLYLLAGLGSWETKPSPVLATRINRLLTITISRYSGFRNTQPHILYLLQGRIGQSHTVCTLSSLSYHTVGILVILCVQICTGELSGLCGLLTALQQP
jgi:hypothetical protein